MTDAKAEIDDNEELNILLAQSPGKILVAPSTNDSVEEAPAQAEAGEYVQWSTPNGKEFYPTSRTQPKLDPWYYEITSCPAKGLHYRKLDVLDEGLIRFPDATSDKVINEIQKFWGRRHIYRDYKILYKRGIILYGPPGGGKSCAIQLACRDLIDRGGIVIKWSHPGMMIMGLSALRTIQPDVPIIVLMEDMDSIIRQYDESEVLNILDGVNKIDKVVFLATTNYPELLGARIINRPSRFDKRFKIGNPSAEARKIYFEYLYSQNGAALDNMDKWVKDTDGLSIAHLKELFVAVNIIGDPYELAIKTVTSMKERISSDFDTERNVGFGKT